MNTVSVIVPVYNVEGFLPKCIESILNQSYKQIEVILIDDGSTDSSGKICDKYALIDNRIKVIHKNNGGLSSARNAGLDVAKGDYLYFVDSDDWIEANTIEENLEILLAQNADMIIFGIIRELKDGTQKKTDFGDHTMSTTDIINASAKMEIEPAVWCRLMKKSIFDSVRFPVGLRVEDIYVIGTLLAKCKRITLNKKCYYHYNLTNNNSITSNKRIVFDSYCLSLAYFSFFTALSTTNINNSSRKFLYENCIKYSLKSFNNNLISKEIDDDNIRKVLFIIFDLLNNHEFKIKLRYKVLAYGILKKIYALNYIDGIINHIKNKIHK